MGTFLVQESEDGTNWNTLETYEDNDFGNSWTNFTTTPDADARYIRFLFSDKISGINVGLDDVSIDESVPTEQEINMTYDGSDVPSGTGIAFAEEVSSTKLLKFGIENIGTVDTLQIISIGFAGSASTDYSVLNTPVEILPASSDTLEIEFTPSSTGNRYVDMEIENNDANEDPYIIQLNGIGGSTASEPGVSPTALTTPMLKTYRVKASFTAGDGSEYIKIFKKNEPITFTPQDGESYEVGEGVGNAKVAAIGSQTQFWLKEATADDTFYVQVYAFNGSGAFTNYRTSDPLDTMIISPKRTAQFTNYYATVDPLETDFIEELHDVIFPHSVRFYSNYGPDMVPKFYARDTTNDQRVLTGIYSGDNVVFSPPFGWSETNMNREHTLPYSWMPSNGSSNTPEYQDYHHLFPSVATANSQRSNDPLGEVVNVTSSYGAGKRGTDSFGNTVYEPRDAQKGDAARAMFYMMTTYHDPTGDEWGLDDLLTNGPDQRQDVLVDWHLNDLPNGFEMARNDYLDSLQENRNPFVDSAHWVCYINFRDMSYIASPDSGCLAAALPAPEPSDTDTTIGIAPVKEDLQWLFYPNPASDRLYISRRDAKNSSVTITDLLGRNVMTIKNHSGWFDISGLRRGMYSVMMRSEDEWESFTLVKE